MYPGQRHSTPISPLHTSHTCLSTPMCATNVSPLPHITHLPHHLHVCHEDAPPSHTPASASQQSPHPRHPPQPQSPHSACSTQQGEGDDRVRGGQDEDHIAFLMAHAPTHGPWLMHPHMAHSSCTHTWPIAHAPTHGSCNYPHLKICQHMSPETERGMPGCPFCLTGNDRSKPDRN